MVDWDSQSGARRQHSSRDGTVPTIVPATRQNSVSRAGNLLARVALLARAGVRISGRSCGVDEDCALI